MVIPDDTGSVWGGLEHTEDQAWPLVLNVFVCADECGLGLFPDLRVAERLWERFGIFGDDEVVQHGIVRFTSALKPDWTYPFAAECGPVDDCYALNVDAETAWACYYNSFPIVRVSEERVTSWPITVRGASALIVGTDTCALIGGLESVSGIG